MKRFLLLVLTTGLWLGCAKPTDQVQILVSPKGLVHSFWLTVKAGAEQAGKEAGVRVIWKGPAQETDIATQIGILEDYINKKVDAIVLAACDANALVPTIEKADAAGIPVIIIDSGVNSEVPKSLVATDNVLAAEKAAETLASLIGEKGKVALIPFVPGAGTSMMREQGFKQGLARCPNIELVAVQYSQSEVERAMSVTENILTAHQDLDGIFAANESGTIGCAQAVKSRGLAGKVKLVGFDASPNEVQALKEGVVDALIVQNPFQMGYRGVQTALAVLDG
ncbi:ABC transporter substrate-binding protein, partial [candidate division KSB1 bacterium]|nr:ABC transporter substrate-binding protein [candidate division KSB1 bacterium]